MITRLLSPREAQQALGVCAAKFYGDQRNGLVPLPIKPGRGARYPEHEMETINRARIAGWPLAKQRALVKALERQRRITESPEDLAASSNATQRERVDPRSDDVQARVDAAFEAGQGEPAPTARGRPRLAHQREDTPA